MRLAVGMNFEDVFSTQASLFQKKTLAFLACPNRKPNLSLSFSLKNGKRFQRSLLREDNRWISFLISSRVGLERDGKRGVRGDALDAINKSSFGLVCK